MTGSTRALSERVTRVWARDAVAFAEVLAELDDGWGTRWFELGGGWVVLCGPGLFVNRAIAVGHDAPLADDDWERLESASAEVGVPAAIEISPVTSRGTAAAAHRRGYGHESTKSVLVRTLDLADVPPPDPAFEIVPADRGLLPVWQETAACGWGHGDAETRRASDAFARAAAVVDGERFTLVRDAASQRPLGCASLTIREGVATLGGMSTMPDERGRGVQTALIRHRLRVAAASGCDLAVTSVVPDGGSERNVLRHGFERAFTIDTWVRP